jgi:hypothetical protein
VRLTKVRPEISKRIGECRLTRSGLVRILVDLHVEVPQRYGLYKGRRHPEDDRLFLFPEAFADGGLMHTFTFLVDDTTSGEHLIITDFKHETQPLGQ